MTWEGRRLVLHRQIPLSAGGHSREIPVGGRSRHATTRTRESAAHQILEILECSSKIDVLQYSRHDADRPGNQQRNLRTPTRNRRSFIRGRASSAVSESFFRSLSRIGKLHPAARPSYHGLEVFENIPYVPQAGPFQKLDIYRPRGPRPPGGFPVVLYVHGGAFVSLSKDTHWIMGLAFARAGYLVCNISYRLAPREPFPAAAVDTCAAFEWVVRNVAAYDGDVSRMILAGESAGANLVTALTLALCYQRPEPWAARVYDTGVMPVAVLPYMGLYEVSDAGRFSRRRSIPVWIQAILNHIEHSYVYRAGTLGPGGLDLANPLTTLERAHRLGQAPARPLPSFRLAVGTRDPILDDTRRLERILTAMDVPVEASYYPGEIHAFHAMVWRQRSRQLWSETFEYLGRVLGERAQQSHSATG